MDAYFQITSNQQIHKQYISVTLKSKEKSIFVQSRNYYLCPTLNINSLNSDSSNLSFSESELIDLLLQKDKKGFGILYDNYSGALYGVILKILKIEEIAQDVLQDSFVKVWKNIDRYNPEKGTLFTWMLNIARNTAIDKFRSQEYKQIIQNKSLEPNVVNKNVENQIPIEHIGIRNFVETLKPEYQEVIDILYFKGYTQSEAAEELKMPLGTIKTRIKIALRELRKLVNFG